MPNIEDLSALKQAWLSARQADGGLVLTPDLVPDGDLRALLQSLPQQRLPLQAAQLADGAAGALVLSGVAAGPLSLPRLPGCVLGSLALDITCSQVAAALSCTCQLTQGALSLNGRTLAVSGQLVSGGLLSLGLAATSTQASGAASADLFDALGACGLSGIAAVGAPVFRAVQLSALQLVCGFDAAALIELDLGAALGGSWEVVPGILSLGKPALAVQWSDTLRGTTPLRSFSGQLQATAAICGQDFEVVAHLSNQQWELDVLPRLGQSLPGLLDLAGMAGAQALQSTLKTGLDALGLGSVAVTALRLGFSPGAGTLDWVEVQGQAGLAGGSLALTLRLPDLELSARLPGAPKGGTAAASGISLKALAAELVGEAADLPEISVTSLGLLASPGRGAYSLSAVTAENWAWDISGNGAGPSLELQQVSCDFQKSPAGTSGGLGAVLSLGGFDLSLSGQYQGKGAGWLLGGSAVRAQSIPIGNLLQDVAQKFGAPVPDALSAALEGLSISYLQLSADTRSKSFQFATDARLSGMFPLGLMAYELDSNVSLSSTLDPSSGARSFNGSAQASMKLGQAAFTLSYDFGGASRVVRGHWRSAAGETVGLGDITRLLGVGDPGKAFADTSAASILSSFDLSLKAVSFEYHVKDGSFTLSAESSRYGDAFLSGSKARSGRWGLLFALELPQAGKLSSIPQLGSALKAADVISFKRSVLLLSTAAFSNYTLPPLPALPPPQGGARGRAIQPVGANAVLQIAPGASVVAVMDLGGGDAKTRNFASIVGQDEVFLQASTEAGGVRLGIGLTGTVGIPTGGSSPLSLANPALRIDLAGELIFQISGELDFSLNGCPVAATVRLIVDESEAQVALNISSSTAVLPSPPGLKGLHFEQFGIEMGVFFEPPGLDIGVQGSFRVGETQAARSDQFAFVLEVVGDVPNPLYLSFYIDRLDLGQALTLFTDRSEPDVVAAMELVKASDLSLHWCENVVVLPDGSVAQPGFGFSATLQILMFSAHAELEVGTAAGIHGRAEMAPIGIAGLLQIAGAGAGITRNYQQVGGQWQEVSNDAIVRSLPAPPTRQEVVLAPGGPLLEFNSQQSPFIRGNWQVSLFDVEKQSVDASFSTSGCSFALSYDLAGIEKFDLKCALADTDHLSAAADCRFGLDATVGPIHVAGFDCGSLHLVATIEAAFSLALDPSSFALQLSGGFDFEGLRFSVPQISLSVAPSSLKDLVPLTLQQIRDHADQLFAQLFQNVEKWAEMIGAGIVTGVTALAQLLKDAFKASLQQAAQLMNLAKQGGEAVAAGLKSAYGATAEAATAAMQQAGYAAEQVAGGLRSAYGLGASAAVGVLKGAGYTVEQIGGALNSAYGQTAAQAATLLKGAGYTATEVGSALKSGYNATADQAAVALKGAGYAANEVGDALRTGWGATSDGVAKALCGAGYAVDQVGGYLKDAYNLGPDALKGTLEGAGYVGDQIKGFFGTLGGGFSSLFDGAGDALKHLDPTSWF